eukprot:3568993-Lingulodinium_polyedra.AAC.1
MALGYGQNKMSQLKECVSTWKVSGWEAPLFKEKIAMRRRLDREKETEAMPWAMIVKEYGGGAEG